MEYVTFSENTSELTLEEKVKILIGRYMQLKEKYATLKQDFERTVTSNIELEDEKTQWENEKGLLLLKVAQIEEELLTQSAMLDHLNQQNIILDTNSKTAVQKIDVLLQQIDTL